MRFTVHATVLGIAALLSGCVTTQGGGLAASSATESPSFGMDTTGLKDMFSSEMRAVKQLVETGKLDEAEASFLKDAEYFKRRLTDVSKPLPPDLQKLGEHVWAKHYERHVAGTLRRLEEVTSFVEIAKWDDQSKTLKFSYQLRDTLDHDVAVNLLRLGVQSREALTAQLQRVNELSRASRAAALASTFEGVIKTGRHPQAYPGIPFDSADYRQAPGFQEAAMRHLSQLPNRAELTTEARRLDSYLSTQSKEAIDRRFAELFRGEVLADGKVTLEEMADLSDSKTPFGGATEQLSSAVRVGYVDLTSASLKNRNIFDFEISFKKDLSLTFSPADESVFHSGNWGSYDYLFVTDLGLAKVNREFKSRTSVKSRVQTGERETPNPYYVEAMTRYQRAMAEYQRSQLSAAIPKACAGWGCALQAIADGIAQGAAQRQVDEASRLLAATSQTRTEPVYSPYEYESVDVNAVKTVDVNYFVIDVKGRRIFRSNFQVNDQENFNVAYNVRDADPDRASIMRNVKAEEEVTAWEKLPIEVPLSALFSAKNLSTAKMTPLTDVPAFLASLSSRNAVAAAPVYARAASSTSARGTSATLQEASSPASQTIADERFDSIVMVQTPGGIGTGFYVTPDLILTAHHVVSKNSLVQLVYYNGTKSFGRVVDHDVRLDLALIRVQTPGKPLKIHTGPLRLGETVEAIGHPKGYEFTITRGVVSALRRQRSATIGSNVPVEFVQTDTPISQGNSGGPLLLGDTVIGVNDWIRVDKGSQNLNFSVSFNEIREFLNRAQAK